MSSPLNLMALPGYSSSQWEAGHAPTGTQMGSEGAEVPTQDAYNWGQINNADLPLINWTGQNNQYGLPYQLVDDSSQIGGPPGQMNQGQGALDPNFLKFMKDGGLKLMTGHGESGYASQFQDAQGNPIGEGVKYGGASEGDVFATALAAAAALAGGEVAGAGGFGGGATLEGGAYPASITGGAGAAGGGGGGALDAYLANGASDLSTPGGLGGYAGAVGSNAAPETLATAGGSSTMYNLPSLLKDAKPYLSAAKSIAPLLGANRNIGVNGPASSGAALPASAPTDFGGVGKFDAKAWDPGTIDLQGRTPSSAVNLQDPSAALFGYGQQPVYFKHGLAEGGTVDDTSDDYWDFGPSTGSSPSYQTDSADDPYSLVNQVINGGGVKTSRNTRQELFGAGSTVPVTSDDGPLGWLQRFMKGDKKTQTQGAIGVGALGLLQSLLAGSTPRNYQTPAQLQGSVVGSQNNFPPALAAKFGNYFNAPTRVYVPPQSPFKPAPHAHGGQVEMGSLDASPHSAEYSPAYHGPLVRGPGGGQEDNVPASLSPGEYVFDADTVSSLGDGSNEEGARKLDEMREAVRAHKRSAAPQHIPPKAHHPLAYLKRK